MQKKIVLMSLGGSVGKTLIATQCLLPHLPNAKILCVDQTNRTAHDFGVKNCLILGGEEFNKAYRELMSAPGDVIVDVGGSKECEEFLKGMLEIDGSDEITTIIIPSTPDSKAQDAAIETLERLIIDGVDKSKIKVVFTGVKKNTASEYSQLIDGMEKNGINADLNLSIFHSKFFDEMIKDFELISANIADDTDYKEKALNRKKNDNTDYIGKLMRVRGCKNSLWPNVQEVYKHLFPEA